VRAHAEGGFSVVEVVAAMAVVTVGALSLLATVPALAGLSRAARESEIATNAARSELDVMRALPFPDPADPTAPNVFTLSQTRTFTAEGLEPPSAGEAHGRVTFLTEAEAGAAFAINLDLDLDQRANETEPAHALFVVFPVRVEVRWRAGQNEVQAVTLTTLIADHAP